MTEKSSLARLRLLLGEFVIIVAGVLVALGVDQWQHVRNDRVDEVRYLERLRADLEWDTTNFARFDRVALSAKVEVLTDLLAPDALTRLQARPDLARDLNYSSFIALPANRPATFEELQSTGNLSLIQDVELRGAISHYYSGFDHISQILAEPFGDYRRRLFAALPGGEHYEWRLNGVAPDSNLLRAGLLKLLADPGLEAAVNSELAYAAGMTFYLRDYYRQAVELLAQLDADQATELR